VRLARLHPEWDRSCAVCETYAVKDDGAFLRDKRTSLPMLRPKGVPTPCGSCAKVPEHLRRAGADVRELRKLAVEMTPANRAAWRFSRECRAVGQFPDDPLVRWAAVIVRDVEEAIERQPLQELSGVIGALAASLAQVRR
jgi:hypothetical protein